MELDKKIQTLKDSLNWNIKFKHDQIIDWQIAKKTSRDAECIKAELNIALARAEMIGYENSLKLVESYLKSDDV